MSDHYVHSSNVLLIPASKVDEAQKIIDSAIIELKKLEGIDDDDIVDVDVEILEEGDGTPVGSPNRAVWIYGERMFSPNQAAFIVQKLMDGLNIDGRFVCSYCWRCDKPEVGQFGGGAFVAQKGKPTVFVDAVDEAVRKADLHLSKEDRELQ